jgi:hypothetical protein
MKYLKMKINLKKVIAKTSFLLLVFVQLFGLPFTIYAQTTSEYQYGDLGRAAEYGRQLQQAEYDNQLYEAQKNALMEDADLYSDYLQDLQNSQEQYDSTFNSFIQGAEAAEAAAEQRLNVYNQNLKNTADRTGQPVELLNANGTKRTYIPPKNRTLTPSTAQSGGVPLLYPVKPPNNVSLDNISLDFVSCIGASMAVSATQIPLKILDQLGTYLGTAISDTIQGLASFWTIGSAGAAGKLGGVGFDYTKTVESWDNVGTEIASIQIIPGGDQVAWCLKNIFIGYLTGTVVKWVNEAANEAGAYIRDWEAYVNNIANLSFQKAVGEANVCVDIKGSVNLSALTNWLQSGVGNYPKNRCTITFDQDYEFMLKGNAFNYDSFYNLYANPNNNFLGATLLVNSAAESNMSRAEDKYRTELNWSNGYINWTDENGKIITPGQVIEQKIYSALNMKDQNTIMADTWDEIMFLLYNQIIKSNLSDVLSI